MAKEKSSPDKKKDLSLKSALFDLASLQKGGGQADQFSVLVFEVGGESFAIGVDNTEGVVDCPRITPLPGSPDGVLGVTSVRGRMTVVMDLSLTAAQRQGKRRLILIKGDAQLGLLTDRVEGVVAVKAGGAPKQEEFKVAWPSVTVFGGAAGPVRVIDVERLAEI
jgi:purine-binding chemotaxis protein CheW